MTAISIPPLHRRRRALVAGAFLLVALLAGVLLGGGPIADAAKPKVLGKTKQTPSASCPDDCAAIASVTGFQVEADGRRQPFKVRENGKIVAWSIELGRPDKEQKKFFGDNFSRPPFGDHPSARLAVLKPLGKARFKLKSHSDAVDLASEYGRSPIITLNDPLKVREGDVLALTVPTWSPSFTTKVSGGDNSWRASRSPKKCSDSLSDVRASKPQEKVGDSRRYGCKFKAARLLYWGYFVANKRDGGGGGGGDNDGGGGGGGGDNDGGGGGGGGGRN